MRKSVPVGLILLVAVLFPGCGGSPSNVQPAPAKPAYVLPSEFFLKTAVSRGPEGEVYIHGSTNLPDGMIIRVEVGAGLRSSIPASLLARAVRQADFVVPTKVYADVTIQNGSFTTTRLMAKCLNPYFVPGQREEFGNSKYLDVPFPPGRKQIHYEADFMGTSATNFNAYVQRPEVQKVVGEGGRNLKGEMFKETDPDIVDSDRVLDYSQTVQFPPLTLEAEAINLVKRAVLTNPGFGRSSTDVDQSVQYNVKTTALLAKTPNFHWEGKGWSARLTGDRTYAVSFDSITDDEEGEHQAVWSANLATRQVKYVNKAAKDLSWVPGY